MASESGKSAEGFDTIFTIKGNLFCLVTRQLGDVHFLYFTDMCGKFLGSVAGSVISDSSRGKYECTCFQMLWVLRSIFEM